MLEGETHPRLCREAVPADTVLMINALLDILLRERTVERDAENFKRGLVRLLGPRPSDHDPINHTKPEPAPAIIELDLLDS